MNTYFPQFKFFLEKTNNLPEDPVFSTRDKYRKKEFYAGLIPGTKYIIHMLISPMLGPV